MTTRWYVVFEGSVPGVYNKWGDYFKQVNKFKSNNYKGFKTREEAEARYRNYW
jgi:ribonuclease HI